MFLHVQDLVLIQMCDASFAIGASLIFYIKLHWISASYTIWSLIS